MRKFLLSLSFIALLFNACEDVEVVPSGTYSGSITEVEADKDEIYVLLEDGKKIELYFTEDTELMEGNSTAPFSTLEEGQKVEVTVEKVGQRLDPIKVVILE